MNLYLMIAILLANIISIGIVYQFIKKLEKKQILIFIAISVAIMYILISIIYWFSGFGIEKTVHEAGKNFILYLFVPVNIILCIPYLAMQYMKWKEKQIKIEKFVNRIAGLLVFLLVILGIEYFYFRNLQQNIQKTGEAQIKQQEENQIENETIQNEIVNELISNEIE